MKVLSRGFTCGVLIFADDIQLIGRETWTGASKLFLQMAGLRVDDKSVSGSVCV